MIETELDGNQEHTAAPEGALLVASDLHKRFGRSTALAGLSVEVRGGEVVAVLGPSGSGKSTLLLCLAGIIPPDQGAVLYRGRTLASLSDSNLTRLRRDEFGFVFQFGQLVPELTAVDNVSLPLRLAGLKRHDAAVRACEWLARLDVDDVMDQRAGEMSGGQAQRIAVARALVTGPRVVFADEPTGSLDSLNGELVMNLMVGAARDQGTTVVLVTHEARVAAYADRELVVRDGMLAEPSVS